MKGAGHPVKSAAPTAKPVAGPISALRARPAIGRSMHYALRSFLALVLVFLGAAAVHAADPKPYARDFLASDAVHLTETLRKEASGYAPLLRGKSAEQLRKEVAGAI